MRIVHAAACLSLFSSLACQDKTFSGATKNGSADSAAEQQDAEPAVESSGAVEQPSSEIEFGVDEVYRIGDGNSGAQSACIGEVKSHDLKGIVYYFQFEILEDDTKVDVSIGKFCGVDQANFTTIALQDSSRSSVVADIAVPSDASGGRANPYAPFSSQSLKKGLYNVVVTSKNTAGKASRSSDPNVDEYDDFVIGNIQIKADKLVRQVKVFAE